MPEQKATLAILFDREPPPEPPTGRRGRIASQRMARINNDANDEYDRYVRQVVDAAPPLTASQIAKLHTLFDYEPPPDYSPPAT